MGDSLGLRIRDFLHDLFGSRLAMSAENELYRLRDDYAERISEKDRLIADYRERIAALESKLDRYELVLLPIASPVGNLFSPKKEREPFHPITDTKSSWEAYQENYYNEQAEEARAAVEASPKES